MAIVAVHRPQQQAERRREPEKDPLDTILKGLQIASSIYGIKTSMEQSRLNDLRAQAMEKALAQEKIEKEQPARLGAGELEPETFFKTFYEVSEPEKFKGQYGDDIPIVDVKLNIGGEVKNVKAVDRDLFKQIMQSKVKQQGEIIKERAKTEKRPPSSAFLAKGFADRIRDANNIFDKLEKEGFDRSSFMTAFTAGVLDFIPFGEGLKSSQLKSFEQASRNFINATLRRESGAAIAESEFENAQKQYLPVIGDDPATLAQKAANRKRIMQSLEAEAKGRLMPEIGAAPAPAPAPASGKFFRPPPKAPEGESNEEFLKRFIRK